MPSWVVNKFALIRTPFLFEIRDNYIDIDTYNDSAKGQVMGSGTCT